MKCGMTQRNSYHKCEGDIQRFAVKRMFDGYEGHLTVCQKEMDRLVGLKAFRIIEEKTQEVK